MANNDFFTFPKSDPPIPLCRPSFVGPRLSIFFSRPENCLNQWKRVVTDTESRVMQNFRSTVKNCFLFCLCQRWGAEARRWTKGPGQRDQHPDEKEEGDRQEDGRQDAAQRGCSGWVRDAAANAEGKVIQLKRAPEGARYARLNLFLLS